MNALADALGALTLPIRMPADPPPQHEPPPPPLEQLMSSLPHWKEIFADRLLTTMRYRGTPLDVSTVPFPMDHQHLPGRPPILWETIIFGTDDKCEYGWRYSTRAAATNGHTIIVNTIRRVRKTTRKRPAAVTSGWPKRRTR